MTVRQRFCRGASAFKVYKPHATRPSVPGTPGVVAGQAALPARPPVDTLQGDACATPGAPQSSCRHPSGACLRPMITRFLSPPCSLQVTTAFSIVGLRHYSLCIHQFVCTSSYAIASICPTVWAALLQAP